MAYGRPLKGSTRRTPITVHASIGMLDIIDQYVSSHAAETGTSYSRSDFYNDAAVALLNSLGLNTDDAQ